MSFVSDNTTCSCNFRECSKMIHYTVIDKPDMIYNCLKMYCYLDFGFFLFLMRMTMQCFQLKLGSQWNGMQWHPIWINWSIRWMNVEEMFIMDSFTFITSYKSAENVCRIKWLEGEDRGSVHLWGIYMYEDIDDGLINCFRCHYFLFWMVLIKFSGTNHWYIHYI